jgi:hypothetical protein
VLFAIPGVHSVGVGTKIIGGRFTDEPIVMVFVERKKPLADMPADEAIPTDIDGVRTDVYEAEIPRIQASDVDNDRYKPLRAGVQIEPGGLDPSIIARKDPLTIIPGTGLGGLGTLGFFVSVAGATPRVYAVTNQHIVASVQRAEHTNLTVATQGLSVTFDTTDHPNQQVTPGTLIIVHYQGDPDDYHAYYTTGQSDTPALIVNMLATRINAAGHGVTATVAGSTLTLSSHTVVGMIGAPLIFPPPQRNSWASVKAVIDNLGITFSGKAKSSCGAFVNWNAGSAVATDGVFVQIEPHDTPEQIAANVAEAVTDLHIVGDAPVTAVASGATVSFGGVQQIECHVSSDARVGQPDSQFCTSRCSRCCDHRIGLLAYVRLNIDTALIQLDPGRTYRSDIEDIGAIAGTHDVHNEPSGFALWKRGRTTKRTKGHLIAHMQDGLIQVSDTQNTPPQWSFAHRYFRNAFTIGVAAGMDPFSIEGDSGAAVVTPQRVAADGARTTTIAGILFGGGKQASFAMHIDDVLGALSAQLVSPAVLDTAQREGIDKNAPALPPMARSALEVVTHRDLTPDGVESERLAAVEREVRATPGGQFYGALVMRHLSECMALVDTNRRVATVWHRNGGPAIANGLLRMLRIPGQRIPSTINGMPLADCLQQIGSALARYGSPALAADIAAHGPEIIRLAGATYPELLAEFGTPVETS